MIAGLLLAAGGARRFGSQKLLASLNGTPIVRRSAETLAQAVDAMIVVVGNDGDRVRSSLDGVQAQIVENTSWADGMATSLTCGVRALSEDVKAVLVALGDQPGLDPMVVRAVVARWRETTCPIVVARYADGRGHPVLFARELFAELMALEGDQGAKPVIERSPERVAFVEVPTAAPRDVDTVEDLRALSR